MKSYSITDLLEGKHYRSHSRNIDGIISYAEKREDMCGENNAYHITVREQYAPFSEFHATVTIEMEN